MALFVYRRVSFPQPPCDLGLWHASSLDKKLIKRVRDLPAAAQPGGAWLCALHALPGRQLMSCCLFSPQTNTVSFLTYCLPECPQRPPNAIKESPGLTDFPFQAFLAEAERCALWLLLCPQSPAPSVATTCRVTQRAPSLTWPGGVDAPTFECFALVWMENACLAGGGQIPPRCKLVRLWRCSHTRRCDPDECITHA